MAGRIHRFLFFSLNGLAWKSDRRRVRDASRLPHCISTSVKK